MGRMFVMCLYTILAVELGYTAQAVELGYASGQACTSGSTRIIGGPLQTLPEEGFIQICSYDQWYHVCDYGWNQEDAMVACKSLQFSVFESHTDGVSLYNTIDDPIGYFDFQCTGIESDLASCSSNGLSPSTCSTNTPAKIKCTPKGTCESAGHTSCCNSSPCSAAGGCMCDFACYSYGTCCNDIALVCPLDYTGLQCGSEMDDKFNISWPKTPAGITAIQPCTTTSKATATRVCSDQGEWQKADHSACNNQEIDNVLNKATEELDDVSALSTEELITVVNEQVPEILEELSMATTSHEESLSPIDLMASNSVLELMVDAFEPYTQLNESIPIQTSESFVDVLNNLLDARNQDGWQEISRTNPSSGSELLLESTERFALLVAVSLKENETEVSFSQENIVVKVQKVPVMEGEQLQEIVFPEPKDVVNFTSAITKIPANITLSSSFLMARAEGSTSLFVANAIFNNLEKYLGSSATLNERDMPGTVIISSQVTSKREDAKDLHDPVTIDFIILQTKNFSSARCVFWEFSENIGNGKWSTAGIETIFVNNSDRVRCNTSHLTSFAVLLDTSTSNDTPSDAEEQALSIVTYIGCVISIVCLILTVIFFLIFGKRLKSQTKVLNFIHLNLAIALLIAYTVFVAGIELAVENDAACTAVAVLLFYFFLASFFWMLCEGIMLFFMVVMVFSRLFKKWWFFFILGWVPPVIPPAVSLWLEFDNITEGADYCWLSTSNKLIWAFVGPILAIIAINAILFFLVIITVIRNQKQRNVQVNKDHKRNIVFATITASAVLLPLLGLTWLFGLIAVNQSTTIFAWLFAVSNSLQGVAIFFFHVVRNEKVWSFLRKPFQKKKKPPPSRTPFSSSSSKPDLQMKPLNKCAMKQPESAAFTPTGNNEGSKVDLPKAEGDKLKANGPIGKSGTPVVFTTTVIHFDGGTTQKIALLI